jgi:hypothetical protein
MTNYSALQQAAATELLARRRARNSVLDFTLYTMPAYEVNWHHRLVCGYLDRFVAGDITRLMIFMPPRSGKSELVSRRLPAYVLGRNPEETVISASYGDDLAKRMNRDVQRIIDSEPYSALFPNTRLNGANVRTVAQGSWLRNSDIFEVVGHSGYYRSSGVGGAITGMGMTVGIVDDPIKNRQEADSPTYRQNVWDWYTSTFYTRLAPGGRILLTVTRWHEDDLAGRLLELARSEQGSDQWTVITLPAVAEEPIATYDPRAAGDALWPDRWDIAELEKTKQTVGPRDWNALFQQRPRAAEGDIFNRVWWDGRNRYQVGDSRLRNSAVARWQFWDTALKDGDSNDPSACVTLELFADYRMAVRHVFNDRLQSYLLPDKILELAQRFNHDGKLQAVIIEDKASGTTAIQTVRATAPAWLAEIIKEFEPRGTKEYRARQASVWCSRDCVLLPLPHEDTAWLYDFADPQAGQLFRFPKAVHDDMVDAFSMGIIYTEHLLATGWQAREGLVQTE